MTRMLPLLLCFKLEKFCSTERKFAELDQNTSAEERERIRLDFWDWIVQSHGIPAQNDDEVELTSVGKKSPKSPIFQRKIHPTG